MSDPAPPSATAPSVPVAPSASAPPGVIRSWVAVAAGVLAVGFAAFAPWVSFIAGLDSVGGYLPLIPMFLVIVLAGLRWAGLLSVREVLLATAMLLTAAGVAALGSSWGGSMFQRYTLSLDNNAKPLLEAFPTVMSVPPRTGDDAAAVDRLIEGVTKGGQPLASLPVGPLLEPFAWTGVLVGLGLLLMLSLTAATSRQWAQHERLPYPAMQVPQALADGSAMRSGGFWAAIAVVLVYWAWNLGSTWQWHPLPAIPSELRLKDFHDFFGMRSDPNTKYLITDHWENLRIRPVVIGLAFLLSLEVGFSVWSGFWLSVVICGWITAAGMPVSLEIEGRAMGGGATLAMAVVVAWLGRHHYWALLRAAVGLGDGAGDRVGVWGTRGLLIACIALVGLLGWLGGSFIAAVLGVLLALAYLIMLARVVAESGLAFFQAATETSRLALALGLPMLLPFQAMVGLLWLNSVALNDTRKNFIGFTTQAAGIAERQDMPVGKVMFGIAAVAFIGTLAALTAWLLTAWTGPGKSDLSGDFRVGSMAKQMSDALAHPGGPWGAWWDNLRGSPALLGAGLLIALVALRRWWTGFAFHPLGLVVATSFPVWMVWFSLCAGWGAKVLTLRYGGPALYSKLRMVAIGLVVGDLLGYTVQFICVLSCKLGGRELAAWQSFG